MGKPDCLPSLWTKPFKHLCLLSAGYTTIHNQHSLELHPKGMISLFHQHAGLGSKPYYFGHVETPDQMTSYTPFPWAKFWKSRFLLIFDFWSPILCGWNQSNHRSGIKLQDPLVVFKLAALFSSCIHYNFQHALGTLRYRLFESFSYSGISKIK